MDMLMGGAFLVVGILLAFNFNGFAESTFKVLSKGNPTFPKATHRSLQAMGVGWVLLGVIFLLPRFLDAIL